MRHLILFAMAIATLFAGAPARAEQSDINAAARSVVRVVLISVSGDEGTIIAHGTGFAVSRDKILTNAHVVAEALRYNNIALGVIRAEGSDRWGARVLAISRSNDLALLELAEGASLEPMTLFTGAPVDGGQVFAIGYPGSVDFAQGFDAEDFITPTSPVKSPGTLTQGRSVKAFSTVMHTAAIGEGNSGGPLVDACGRVLGVNSFAAVGGESDSAFYFAVATSEVMRFLTKAEIKPQATGTPCRSLEDLEASEKEKASRERERDLRASAKQAREFSEALDAARLDIMEERENGMTLAALCLLLALAVGGAAFHFSQQDDRNARTRIAAGVAVLLLVGAIAAWFSRPSVTEAEDRALAMTGGDKAPATLGEEPPALAGNLVCVIDMSRSRLTVSDSNDVLMSWRGNGCVNNRTQYGFGSDGWSRILVPDEDQTVTVAVFDPAKGIYQTRRYLLDLETMTRLREMRAAITPPSCGSREAAARDFGSKQAELSALLPQHPNELLLYNCSPQD